MRLNLLYLSALLLLASNPGRICAQQTMNVKTKSGGSSTFLVNETRKMTFVDGKLVVTKKDNSTSDFPLSDIRFSNYIMTTTWDGNEWSHSAPTESDIAIIDGLYEGEGFSSMNLTVNPGKGLTIASGQQKVTDNLLLKSDASAGTATLIDRGSLWVGGDTRVEQFLSTNRPFWYVSSPLSAAKAATFMVSQPSNIVLFYNEAEAAYSYGLAATSDLEVGKGYVVMVNDKVDGVYTFSGGNLNSGDIDLTSTRTGTKAVKRGYNLVGNPYPSYLNWDSVYNSGNRDNVLPTIWYRTYSEGAMVFQTYNAALKLSVPMGVNGFIPPLQAFWIRVENDPTSPENQTSGILRLSNTMRAHAGSTGNSASNRLKVRAAADQTIVRLSLSNGKYSDETVLAIDSEAVDAFDSFDSQKMSNDNPDIPELYSLAGIEKLAINGMNDFSAGKRVSLGYKPGRPGVYTLMAEEISHLPEAIDVILKDELDGTELTLATGSSYSFNSSAMESTSRFSLIFKTTSAPSANEHVSDESLLVYSTNAKQIVIEYNGSIDATSIAGIHNLMGQKLISTPLTGPVTLINQSLPSGVYLVSIACEGRNITKKVIIN